MLVFIVRRLFVSFFVLLAATFLMYVLTANAGDPLEDLYTDQSPNRDQKIAARTEALGLDQPVAQRYLGWLGGVSKCLVPGAGCDLGVNRNGQDVSALLAQALTATLQLVVTAAVLAIILGVGIGIVTALRQYSGFDYSITFASFLFFSLPIFWVAVMLKQYAAIEFNNWLSDPVIPLPAIVVLSVVSGLFWMAVIGGNRSRRLTVLAGAAVATALVLFFLSSTRWFAEPGLGIGAVAVLAVGFAFLSTLLIAGFTRRKVLYAALATAAAGIVSYFATGPVLINPTWWHILALVAITVAVSAVIGKVVGGEIDGAQAIKVSVLTGLLTGLTIFVHHVLDAVPTYSRMVGGRIVSTVGSQTPNFRGDFWEVFLDKQTHVILPTLALILISFATYVRYTRSSMLEVMNQDYVRTARAKGLTERTVVMRHAFRNALIPVTTLMAFDFAAIVGGAVITEQVFAWRGMGTLFANGLEQVDPNPVMAFFLVTGTAIVIFNMVADILYAYLDPRIRLS
ncbi:ABC transporter permease [Thalassiella azotivora]